MTTEIITKTDKMDATARQEIINEMPDALLWKFEEIRAFVIDEAISVFRRRHKLGCMVLEVTNDEDKYGKHAVDQMSKLLSMDNSLLYNAKLFAERYSMNDLEELTNLRNRIGDSLTWSHVVQLIRVPDRDARLQLQQQTADNSWTYQELLKQVQDNKGGKTSKGGRPLAKPTGLDGFITQVDSMSSKWIKCSNDIWLSEDGGLDEITADLLASGASAKTITDIRDLESKVRNLATAADILADELKATRKLLEDNIDTPKPMKHTKDIREPVIA